MAAAPQIGVYNLPPPCGGWNERDAITDMPETDAKRLVNWFPGKGKVTMFYGSRYHNHLTDNVAHTLVRHVAADGTQQLIGCHANYWADHSIFDVHTQILPVAITPTSDKWQTVSGNYHTLFFNGADTPQDWDGSTLDDATYTASGLTPSNLIGGCSYRERLYLIEKDSLKFYYTAAKAITGAITEFDLSYVCNNGGYLMAVETWTHDDGGGTDDQLVCITSEGEVIVYQGDYPGNTWWRVGQYYLPKPLGRRCTFRMAGDLYILTEEGILGMSEVLSKGAGGDYTMLTDKIGPAWVSAVASYRNLWGWEAVIWRGGPYLLINVPTSAATSDQFIMNTQTRAWCKRTGWNATTWEVFNDKLYYAATSKYRPGVIFEANYGANDEADTTTTTEGRAKATDLKTAFSYFGYPLVKKLFSNAELLFTSNSDMDVLCDVDVDFEDVAISDTLTVTGGSDSSAWDIAEWDVAEWGDTETLEITPGGLSGFGTCAALKLKANYLHVTASFFGAKIFYEPAGY